MIARFAKIAFGTVTATLAVCAHADEDVLYNSFRVGAYYITYDTQADDLRGPYVPPGARIKLKDVITPYFAYVRRLNSHFSVELALGVPPRSVGCHRGEPRLGRYALSVKVALVHEHRCRPCQVKESLSPRGYVPSRALPTPPTS